MAENNFRKGFIGVFDSGFGGLEVLREIIEEMPQYDYIYLGDTARAPYGNRSRREVHDFTREAVNFLFEHNCYLIILACNTASSEALRRIQREYLPRRYPHRRVLGVIIPAAEEAVKITRNNHIGIIATEGTVASGTFKREIKKLSPKAQIFQKACPLLVPIVERGEQNSKKTKMILEDYLKPLMKENIDTLILGCTHYGLLKNQIRKIVAKKINIVSEGQIIAKKLKDYLKRHPEIEINLSRNSKVEFLTTGLIGKFETLGAKFFGQSISSKKVFWQK